MNRHFTDYFGLDDATVLSQTPEQLMDMLRKLFEPSDSLSRAPIWRIADPEQAFQESMVQVSPSRREFNCSSLPVTNLDQTYLGRLYVWHDMTHEREVERMKSTVTSMVTHELRSPLTCINGYLDLLLGEETADTLTEEQREYLRVVQSEAHRMLSLTNDLLDLSYLTSGALELHREPFNLNDLIKELLPAFQLRWEAKGQTFTLQLPTQAPLVLGDTDRVRQILTNLLSNAHKYTLEEGIINLSVQTVESFACIAVTDSGIGLSIEEQAQLFTQFYRAKNPLTKQVSGTGLGLTIVKSLVEMQGGEIQVLSAPDHGSTFRFTLPLAENDV